MGWGVITFMSCACLWMLRSGTLVEATVIVVTCVPLDATLLYVGVGWGGWGGVGCDNVHVLCVPVDASLRYVGGSYINCCNLRAIGCYVAVRWWMLH